MKSLRLLTLLLLCHAGWADHDPFFSKGSYHFKFKDPIFKHHKQNPFQIDFDVVDAIPNGPMSGIPFMYIADYSEFYWKCIARHFNGGPLNFTKGLQTWNGSHPTNLVQLADGSGVEVTLLYCSKDGIYFNPLDGKELYREPAPDEILKEKEFWPEIFVAAYGPQIPGNDPSCNCETFETAKEKAEKFSLSWKRKIINQGK